MSLYESFHWCRLTHPFADLDERLLHPVSFPALSFGHSALALCAVGASSCESLQLLAGVGVPLCRADVAMRPAAPGQDRAASCSAAFPPLPCFRGSTGGVCSRQMKGAGWYWIFFY